MTDGSYQLGVSEVLTLLFVMLGPIKMLGPFARATAGLDGRGLRTLAFRAVAIGSIVAILGGLMGEALLHAWQVPVMVLRLAGGLIFLVVAFRMVLQPYREPGPPPAAPAAPPAAAGLVFPLVITPFGIAAIIVLLAMSRGADRTALILALVLLVMALDLLAMLYVRPLMRVLAMPLQAVGAVLGVLQVAVALQMILSSLRHLGIVGGGS
jgi:multiple antibiotic resistance protein